MASDILPRDAKALAVWLRDASVSGYENERNWAPIAEEIAQALRVADVVRAIAEDKQDLALPATWYLRQAITKSEPGKEQIK